MVRLGIGGVVLLVLVSFASNLYAQNIYDLRKLTEQQWLTMSTEQRLSALGVAYMQADNQTFVGQFGRYQDLYKKWGYEFYEMNDQYENYSFRGYENYNIINERRVRWSYNEFGDRIAKMRLNGGRPVFLWHETYNDDGSFLVAKPATYINDMSYGQPIDGVWVAKEGTNDWAMSVIAAGSLRTKYTPLTLSIPNIDGIRLDFQSTNNTVSFINSVPIGDVNELTNQGGVLLRAGHFQRKIGALTMGATYANMYSVQGNRDKGNTWYGSVSNWTPTPMVVALRVMDDSPNDGEGGPLVSDVRLKVNGKYRDDIRPQAILDDVTRELTSAITDELEASYLYPTTSIKVGAPKVDFLTLEGTVPKYIDYFYLNDVNSGLNRANAEKKFSQSLAKQYYQSVDPRMPVQVNGTQYIVYMFDISTIKEQTNRVEAELTVSNDYRIQTASIYTKNSVGGHDPSGNYSNWYNTTYWRTSAQAEGNIKDGSNLKRITVDFGVQVASIVYGLDADFNYHGFKITGEYVANSNHYMFPDDFPGAGFPNDIVSGQPARKGYKWAETDQSYYVTMKKDWTSFGFAGEYFRMGNFYKPYLDYYYPLATTKGYGVGSVNARNSTVRLPLIEDNDDNDQYPDTMFIQRVMGYNIQSTEDPDGVFPGNDADNDGIADNNKNNNDVPDYIEPFLMFDVDPDDFVFGNDYNNNNIPDFREDDMKLDTPYDLDRQGHHFYFRFTPQDRINIIVGSMRTKGVGLDNRTNDDYFKFQVNYDVFDIGKLYAEYRYERIQDNIRDAYMQVSNQMLGDFLQPGITATVGRFSRDIYYDELEYKNSKVNRLWIESTMRPLSFLTLENHLKLEKNNELEGLMYDNTYQPKLDINTVAMVNKVMFIKSWGNWTFSPGVKFRFYKKDRGQAVRFGDYYLMRIPLLMVKYTLSPRTDIQLGMQGIPGFEFNLKDLIQTENNYKQKTYTIQLQNRSVYFGYNIWAATGISYDQKTFDEAFRAFENYKSSTLFLKVNLGYN